MRAINEVKKAGSIEALVESGALKSGIMRALARRVPFVLAVPFEMMVPCPTRLQMLWLLKKR